MKCPAAKGYQERVIAGLFPEGQEEQLPCQVQGEPDISGQWAVSMERLCNFRRTAGSDVILVTEDISH